MSPGKLDLRVVRGDDYELPNLLRSRNLDGTPGAYRDMTGWTGHAEIWKDDKKVADIGVLVDTGVTGRFVLSMSSTVTQGLPSSGATWFLRFTDAQSKTKTWLTGRVLVRLPGDPW